jgi:hypothetical protein
VKARLREAWDVFRGRAEARYPESETRIDWPTLGAWLELHPLTNTPQEAADRWAKVAMAKAIEYGRLPGQPESSREPS